MCCLVSLPIYILSDFIMFAQYRLSRTVIWSMLSHMLMLLCLCVELLCLGLEYILMLLSESREQVMLFYFLYVWFLIISRTMKVYCLHRMTVKPLMEKFSLARNLTSTVFFFSLYSLHFLTLLSLDF